MSKWDSDQDWTYHGLKAGGTCRLLVETAEFGPTERLGVRTLRELNEPLVEVSWGYRGGSPFDAAELILRDALHEEPDAQLVRGFTEDVMSQMTDEWRMRRGAVLRWVRGWYTHHDGPVPAAASDLPPTDPREFETAPHKRL